MNTIYNVTYNVCVCACLHCLRIINYIILYYIWCACVYNIISMVRHCLDLSRLWCSCNRASLPFIWRLIAAEQGPTSGWRCRGRSGPAHGETVGISETFSRYILNVALRLVIKCHKGEARTETQDIFFFSFCRGSIPGGVLYGFCGWCLGHEYRCQRMSANPCNLELAQCWQCGSFAQAKISTHCVHRWSCRASKLHAHWAVLVKSLLYLAVAKWRCQVILNLEWQP